MREGGRVGGVYDTYGRSQWKHELLISLQIQETQQGFRYQSYRGKELRDLEERNWRGRSG